MTGLSGWAGEPEHPAVLHAALHHRRGLHALTQLSFLSKRWQTADFAPVCGAKLSSSYRKNRNLHARPRYTIRTPLFGDRIGGAIADTHKKILIRTGIHCRPRQA